MAAALADARRGAPRMEGSPEQPAQTQALVRQGRQASADAPGEGDADAGAASTSAPTPPLLSVTALDTAVLANVADFDRWWGAVQAARTAEAEGAHTAHAGALASRAASVGRLVGDAADADAILDRLTAAHAEVAARAAALRGAAGALVAARERAAARGAALASRLAAFSELDAVTAALVAAEPLQGGDMGGGGSRGPGGAAAPPTSTPAALDDAGLVAALGRAADALAALAARPHYRDAAPYAARLRAALARGAALVRARAGAVLAAATEAAAAGGEGGGDEEVLANLRFRAVAEPGLAPLLAGVGARVGVSSDAAGAPEFGALLADVRASFCGARLAAVGPRVRASVEAAAAATAGRPADLAAAGAAALAAVAAQEVALYRAVFGPALAKNAGEKGGVGTAGAAAEAAAAADLSPLIDPLATLLYDALRPAVVRLASVDDLVDVVGALTAAAAAPSTDGVGAAAAAVASSLPAAARAAAADALRPVLARVVADAQARLAFRVQAYVKEQVVGFVPGEADLAYPDLVEGGAAGGTAGGGGGGAGVRSPTPPSEPLPSHAAGALYPPCARAADVLDATVSALAPSVFAGLAQDAVCGAAAAVAAGAPAVARRASPADGHLFAVRSLMGLRSRLAALGGPDMTSPPDTDVQFDLDFASVRDQMLSLLGADGGRGGGGGGFPSSSRGPSPGAPPTPLTSASTPRSATLRSASSALASSLAPRSSRRRVDGARELDAALRGACEAAIMAATRAVADPLLSLITKATAARVAAALAGGVGGGGSSAVPPPRLRDHAFAAPDRVAAALAAAAAAATGELPRFAAKARLYIPDPGARGALLRPVKANLAEAYAQVAALLEAEYEAGEAGRVGMPSPEVLGVWLGVLDG